MHRLFGRVSRGVAGPAWQSTGQFAQQSRMYTPSPDLYDRLGVSKGASQSEIKKAYKKLAMELHPDRNPKKEAAEKFAAINEAYGIISDPEKRQMYDTYGKDYAEGGGMGGMGGAGGPGFDPFADIFGGMGGMQQRKARTPDSRLELPVTLETLYKGGTETVRFARKVLCEAGKNASHCPVCKGAGMITRTRQVGPGMLQQVQEHCSACSGSGFKAAQRCGSCSCGGNMTQKKIESVDIPIRPGQDIEDELGLPGLGDEAVGAVSGDVIVTLKLKPDPRLRIVGSDLLITQKVSLQDALAGCTINLPHPSGNSIKTRLQPGDLSGLHSTRVISNQGMPTEGQTFGDYLVDFQVELPHLDAEKAKDVAHLLGRAEGVTDVSLGKEAGKPVQASRVHSITEKQKQDRLRANLEAREQRRQRRHRGGGAGGQQASCSHQ